MDDLNGLDWSTSSRTAPKAPAGTGNYYPTLRPTPPPQNSGRNTPLSAQGSGAPRPASKPFSPPKSSTPDSFSNLVSFGSSKTNTLTLQQQQEKLQAEKRKQEEEKRRQLQAQFGNNQFWDGLGSKGSSLAGTPPIASRSSTPALQPVPAAFARATSPAANNTSNGADEDLFAAFSADAPVDKSSYYPPPPSAPASGRNTPGFVPNKPVDLSKPQAWEQPGGLGADLGDDDDPFGLGQMKAVTPVPITTNADDDDFLGDLAKPVEEIRRASPPKREVVPEPGSDGESDDPWDKAVAELVDMGFSAEQSRRALTESGSGLDIQAAVGWILNDAHRQAKQKQQGGAPTRNNESSSNGPRRDISRDSARREQTPSWMREEGRDGSRPRREDNRSPNGEADFSKQAAAVGTTFLKTANSLWKTSQKKVQKAVAEFQQESDPNQPKWMREAAERENAERRAAAEGRGKRPEASVPDVTDEALMLEGGGRPQRKAKAPTPEQRQPIPRLETSHDRAPTMPRPPPERSSQPRWQQNSAPPDPRARISKQAIEEQSAQAYISPARRKKATPQPPREPEVDLFSSAPPSRPSQSQPPRTVQRSSPPKSKPSTPVPSHQEKVPNSPVQHSPPNISYSHESTDSLCHSHRYRNDWITRYYSQVRGPSNHKGVKRMKTRR